MSTIFYAFTRNAGDDLQSIALISLLKNIETIVSRDHIPEALAGINSRGILSGWLSYNVTSEFDHSRLALFCPPLSIHIENPIHVQKSWLEYLRISPFIVARDLYTRELINGLGIDAEFGGCPTLLLSNFFLTTPCSFDYQVCTELHYIETAKQDMKHCFYFNPCNVPRSISYSLPARMAYALCWLKLIAGASTVITDRIHAAFPAISFGVKTIFPHHKGEVNHLPTGGISRISGYGHLLGLGGIDAASRIDACNSEIEMLTETTLNRLYSWMGVLAGASSISLNTVWEAYQVLSARTFGDQLADDLLKSSYSKGVECFLNQLTPLYRLNNRIDAIPGWLRDLYLSEMPINYICPKSPEGFDRDAMILKSNW